MRRHWIHLDHDQKLTSSGGITYSFTETHPRWRQLPSGQWPAQRPAQRFPNGASLPFYFQFNLNVAHDFTFGTFGKVKTQLAVINALDRTYELRDGTAWAWARRSSVRAAACT